VKNLDTGENFLISDVDKYCDFDSYDDFSNNGLPFLVKMNGHTTQSSTAGEFTVYHCEVHERKGDDRCWNLTKRYSDFVQLHTLLKDVGYKVAEIEAALPPKRWFGNLEGDVVTFRQRALERYLQLCLNTASPDDCTAVRTFLETSSSPQHQNPASQNPSFTSALPITPPSNSSSRRESRNQFESTSMNDEERALSNMLSLSMVEDDGAPTPIKADHGYNSEDEEYVTVRRDVMQDMLSERETLYAEMLRYKEENASLFRDLGTAEDLVEELQEELERLKGGEKEEE